MLAGLLPREVDGITDNTPSWGCFVTPPLHGFLSRPRRYETGIDLKALIECSAWLAEQLGKELPGQVYKAGGFAPIAG